MPGYQDPVSGLWQGYDTDESGWEDQISANFLKIGAVMQIAVVSRTAGSVPNSPADGERHIVPAGATGPWVNKDNMLAIWRSVDTVWEFYQPVNGWVAVVGDEGTWGTMTTFKGGSWSPGTALA